MFTNYEALFSIQLPKKVPRYLGCSSLITCIHHPRPPALEGSSVAKLGAGSADRQRSTFHLGDLPLAKSYKPHLLLYSVLRITHEL
jgi:hypothetical protein